MSWQDQALAILARAQIDAFQPFGTTETKGTKAPRQTASIVPFVPSVPSEDREERAAIVAEGANVPREWAEAFADLQAAPPPAGVSAEGWLAMLNSAGRLLDSWGGKAAALGWSAREIFGVSERTPVGAAFLMADEEVIAITEAEILIRVGTALRRHIRERVELEDDRPQKGWSLSPAGPMDGTNIDTEPNAQKNAAPRGGRGREPPELAAEVP